MVKFFFFDIYPDTVLFTMQFGWSYAVDGITYVFANTIDSACSYTDTNSTYYKLMGTSGAKMILSLIRDRKFDQLFGTKKPSPVPLISFACWFTRDNLTMFSAFILPSKIANLLIKNWGWSKEKAKNATQFFFPIFL